MSDVRFAFRYFGRNKLTVAIILSVFALGIGANTALVTAMQSQFQRPAPALPNDDAHVRIWGEERATPIARWRWRGFTGAELTELATGRETFSAVAGWLAHDVVLNVSDTVGPRGVRAQFVTPNYFTALGVPVVGSGFSMAAGDAADMSAVMSFAMAERIYGTATNAVGQRVLVNDIPVRVVGLAPRRFQGALRNMDAGRTALYIPLSARADIARVPARWLTESPTLDVMGRVAPGVSRDKAAAAAQMVIARTLPDSASRTGMTRKTQVLSLHAMEPQGSEETILIFGLLSVAGLLLLLVTCTNISSLMVAAAVARRHEIAVRLSLGASRARVLRQLLTETSLLAITGGAAGLLVCWWLLKLLSGDGTIDGNAVMPDAYTLAYTMAIALGTGIVFGLSPALHATRDGVGSALRDSGMGASRRSRLQRGFVVAQIVFSQPLLLMLGVTLSMVLGEFQPLRPELSERVTRVTFRPLTQTGAPGQRREAVDSLIPRIAAHPEVTGVVPEASWFTSRGFITPSRDTAASKEHALTTLTVEGTAPGWFALLDIPILLGRDVSLADTAEHRWPVVIGNDLARLLWDETHPIGKTLLSPGRDSIELRVVGVYDAALATTRGTQLMRVFTAYGKEWRRDAVLVRTRGSAEAHLPELRRLIRDQAPGLPVTGMRTLAHIDEEERTTTVAVSALVGGGGALALLLASLGLYGVIALAVRQRTREIGIRIALGAKPTRVARMFLGSGIGMGGLALAIGMPVSLVLLKLFLRDAELLASKVNVWAIGGGVAAALLIVAAAATWVPARRASLVDPARTLRVD